MAARKPARKAVRKAAKKGVRKASRKAAKKPARKAARKGARKSAKAPRRAARPSASKREMVTVQNVNVPGYSTQVDAARYRAMRETLLRVLPKEGPGVTQAEMFEAAERAAPARVFPNGGKVAWWVKTVQLDLEAKGVMTRDRAAKPLRWRLA
ncbi:MAG TPA: hypothetical protein VHH36_06540 [Candidatus Thermoplasmatota archaeon]|nr:hypothetical protein [Candidatus Thermoplasmatota archaeon]